MANSLVTMTFDDLFDCRSWIFLHYSHVEQIQDMTQIDINQRFCMPNTVAVAKSRLCLEVNNDALGSRQHVIRILSGHFRERE